MDAYQKTVKYLDSFVNYERTGFYPRNKPPSLKRIRNFLALIGNPQDELRVIHVAGSKGKGSVCAFIAHILREAGFSAGLYTSPHLSDFRERIRILNPGKPRRSLPFEGMISKREITRLAGVLRPAIKRFGTLSLFEVYTALAFLYFKEKKVDFAVLETGMGGRLDATNVVNSLVSAITPISYEHTMYLGNTLREIASEKAGIIKRGSAVVSSPQRREAEQVIKRVAARMQARLFTVGRDIGYSAGGLNFSIRGIRANYKNLKINLLGRHQVSNACLAVGVIEGLGAYGFKVGVDCVRKGLYNTIWPGRLEVLGRKPCIVVDGAQNAASAEVLSSAIKNTFRYRRIILVFGVSQDKDIAGLARELSGMAHKIVLTSADNPRAAKPQQLIKFFPDKTGEVFISSGVREARKTALGLAGENDLILVTGSLFVVGEFRDACG